VRGPIKNMWLSTMMHRNIRRAVPAWVCSCSCQTQWTHVRRAPRAPAPTHRSHRGCGGAQGYPLVLMSPVDFVNKPTRWLDNMARHGTSHTVSPDFALGLVTKCAAPAALG